ncbi:hypothetical protein D3C72_716260 [compost metagenome]
MTGAALDGRHGKTAGVGKQIEHTFAVGLLARPVAPVTHVEKQPGVLFAPQVDAVLQAALDDAHFFDFIAQQPFGSALWQVAMLDQQRVRARLFPFGGICETQQQRFEIVQLLRRRFLEQRHQHHALQPVHGQLLQPGPAATAPVEQATGFARCSREGRQQMGVEGGEGFRVHRSESASKRAGILTTNTPSRTIAADGQKRRFAKDLYQK